MVETQNCEKIDSSNNLERRTNETLGGVLLELGVQAGAGIIAGTTAYYGAKKYICGGNKTAEIAALIGSALIGAYVFAGGVYEPGDESFWPWA